MFRFPSEKRALEFETTIRSAGFSWTCCHGADRPRNRTLLGHCTHGSWYQEQGFRVDLEARRNMEFRTLRKNVRSLSFDPLHPAFMYMLAESAASATVGKAGEPLPPALSGSVT